MCNESMGMRLSSVVRHTERKTWEPGTVVVWMRMVPTDSDLPMSSSYEQN